MCRLQRSRIPVPSVSKNQLVTEIPTSVRVYQSPAGVDGVASPSQQELLQIYLTSPILMSTIARGTINNNHVFKSLTPKVVAEDDHDDADQDDDNVDDNDVENNVIMTMTMTMMMRTM